MSKERPPAAELQTRKVIAKIVEGATSVRLPENTGPRPSAQAAPQPSPPSSIDGDVRADIKAETPGQTKRGYFRLNLAFDPGVKDYYNVYRLLYPEKSKELLNTIKKIFIRELERAYQEDETFRSLLDKKRGLHTS
jgi:hypothetical protein